MLILRFHEPNDPCTSPTNVTVNSSRIPSNITKTTNISTFLLFLASKFNVAAGTPLQSAQNGLLQKRDASTSSSGIPPKIMVLIAIVVVGFLVLVGAVVSWRKRSLRRQLNPFSLFSGAAGAPMGGPASATRELTAEQLAGTINGDIPPGGGNGATRTTRRARRPRRTPSQMSVTSLPVYNKEPGEEELVIFRGRDMEDATMPAATTMTSLDEERSSFSHEDSHPDQYSPMPTSPNNMPLLQEDGDLSLQSIPDVLPPHASTNSLSSHETSSLMRTSSNLPEDSPDPRGEAPAYFEVVDTTNDVQNTPATNVRRQPSNASAAAPNTSPNRRSGFRTLLNRMSMVSAPPNHHHNRNESVNSTFSSNVSHTLEPTSSRISGHRPTHSGSGSLLSVHMFRTLSRQKSNHTLNSNRLNSPSLISLNSISSPLTHTATRTEFTYPKSGPTAEQLKMISSRESIVRFGVPYGADAIAYASSSRLDLIPPPDFDSTVTEPSRAGASAGPSRLRSTSNLVERPSEATRPAATGNSAVVIESPVPSSSSPSPQDMDENKPSSTTTDMTVVSGNPAAVATAHAENKTENKNASSEPSHQKLSSESRPDATTTTGDAKESQNAGSLSWLRNSQSTSPTITQSPVSEFGTLAIPPSSSSLSLSTYNDRTVSSVRSESRASVFTFATARESLSPSTRSRSGQVSGMDTETETDEFFSEAESESAPSTPRLGQHGLELTDETITQHDSKRDTIVASNAKSSSSSS